MSKYGELRKKYDILVKTELKKNEEILKESFIEYFGEENRSLIESRFKEIVYIYYINWDIISFVCEKVPKEYQDNFKPYFEFREKRESCYYSFIGDRIFPDCFIGTSDENVFFYESIYAYILERLKLKNPYCSLKNTYYGPKRLICFNLFVTDEKAIIHEINHSITKAWILRMFEDNMETIYAKSGLNYEDGIDDDVLEELITDKSSLKIYEIFKRRGGDLTSFLMGGIYESAYEYNHYLVERFFEYFEDLLKIARIGENKNLLLKKVGKEGYRLLCEAINDCYVTDGKVTDKNQKRNLKRINSIVDYMEEYAKSQEELSDDDINSYYQYLRDLGKKVTILNKI